MNFSPSLCRGNPSTLASEQGSCIRLLDDAVRAVPEHWRRLDSLRIFRGILPRNPSKPSDLGVRVWADGLVLTKSRGQVAEALGIQPPPAPSAMVRLGATRAG